MSASSDEDSFTKCPPVPEKMVSFSIFLYVLYLTYISLESIWLLF